MLSRMTAIALFISFILLPNLNWLTSASVLQDKRTSTRSAIPKGPQQYSFGYNRPNQPQSWDNSESVGSERNQRPDQIKAPAPRPHSTSSPYVPRFAETRDEEERSLKSAEQQRSYSSSLRSDQTKSTSSTGRPPSSLMQSLSASSKPSSSTPASQNNVGGKVPKTPEHFTYRGPGPSSHLNSEGSASSSSYRSTAQQPVYINKRSEESRIGSSSISRPPSSLMQSLSASKPSSSSYSTSSPVENSAGGRVPKTPEHFTYKGPGPRASPVFQSTTKNTDRVVDQSQGRYSMQKPGTSPPNYSPSRSSSSYSSASTTPSSVRVKARTSAKVDLPRVALLVDCDSVLMQTEDLHRVAFNKAFRYFGLVLQNKAPVEWDEEYFEMLRSTLGSERERLLFYFKNDLKQWPSQLKPFGSPPSTSEAQERLIDKILERKEIIYKELVASKASIRPNILDLIDCALSFKNKDTSSVQLSVGVCSSTTRKSFTFLMERLLGSDCFRQLDLVLTKEDLEVNQKKANAEVYKQVAQTLKTPLDHFVVIQDDFQAFQAANAVGMYCLIAEDASPELEAKYLTNGALEVLPSPSSISFSTILRFLSTIAAASLVPTSSKINAKQLWSESRNVF